MDEAQAQRFEVFDAEAFRVDEGVARGEALSFADELVPGDLYRLAEGAARRRLAVSPLAPGAFRVLSGARDGRAGRTLHLDCCLTLMASDGGVAEAIVLVEVEDGQAVAVYLMALGPLRPGGRYRLVGLDRHAGTGRLALLAAASFVRGTRIAMADGRQVPVEALRPGDLVLTRDDGPRPLRWIGRATLRATGRFAPVLIREGALHNARDLVLAPDHRVFVWQREDRLGAGRAELLVRVGHLVDGVGVVRREGGFVDYLQLVFDAHQIVYAEGIAAESLLVDHRTRGALPGGMASHARPRHLDYEVDEQLVSGPDAAALLRRASGA